MRTWACFSIGLGAIVASAALFAGQVNTAAAPTTDAQLAQARTNLEVVTSDARKRRDFRSARRAVWALLSYAELRASTRNSGLPQTNFPELLDAWCTLETRAEMDDQRAELRPRYDAVNGRSGK